MSEDFIYLDNNATTPLLSEVADAMHEVMGMPYGNPSSPHSVGEGTRGLIEDARSQVAGLIGTDPDHIIFTSCGSEANNQAILSALGASGLNRVVTITAHKINGPQGVGAICAKDVKKLIAVVVSGTEEFVTQPIFNFQELMVEQ